MQTQTSPAKEEQAAGAELQEDFVESKQQPLWHVAVLNVMTLFAYSIFWFFKTWTQLADEANTKADDNAESPLARLKGVSPMLRTIGGVIPIVQIWLSIDLFRSIASLSPTVNAWHRINPLAAGALLTAALYGLLSLYKLPGAFYLLYLLAAVPLTIAQGWLNQYWRSVEPKDLLVRHAFSVGELVALIAGAILLGLNVTHFAVQ